MPLTLRISLPAIKTVAYQEAQLSRFGEPVLGPGETTVRGHGVGQQIVRDIREGVDVDAGSCRPRRFLVAENRAEVFKFD